MKRALWLLVFLVGCEGKREAPKPLAVSLPSASAAPTLPLGLFADIYRRRPVPPGTQTSVDRVETELAKNPTDTKRLKAVGLAYYAAGGYEAAIKKLTGLDTDSEAQLYLGFAHMGLNNYAEALTALKKAKGAVALLEQGNLYFQVPKQDDEAEKYFKAALKRDTGDTHGEAALALGLLQASQGKSEPAQKLLHDASEVLPAGKARATAFAALGRLESDPAKARAWYEKTRKDDPENPWLKKLSK